MFTENEIISNSRLQVDGLVSALKRKKISLAEVGDFIPGFLHLNNCDDFQMTYLNKFGQESWEADIGDIRSRGIDWQKEVCQPDVLAQSMNKVKRFNNINDTYGILSYYQLIRTPSKPEFEWHFTCKRKFSKQSNISISHNITQFGSAANVMKDILDDNIILKKNHQPFHTLTKSEKWILKLIAKGHRSRDISELLHISFHTVNTHRRNIWAKLGVKTYAELHRIAMAFDLIEV